MNDAAPTVMVRQRAARALARADASRLAAHWAAWPDPPTVEYLRGPEAGLVMVQGRIGGSGDRFNVGEATVTRATAVLRGGCLTCEQVGTSYVLGSDTEHAGLAAIFDALVADPATSPRALAEVVEPLEREHEHDDARACAEARATQVNFLTVARENTAGMEDDDQ
ncbi:MAG: phosphonate C-P lyase system protein PhnG [Micrococcales bacterium]|nr:phosphonate C-P lyase system protein PhnG [Micrococcales bacterium]MCL2667912.1 phosphonate C-P lyase system protein PhnG [Micrococcales bacterium]